MTNILKTEEDVKLQFLIPLLRERGYKENCLDFNKAIEIQEGRKRKKIFADVVVYSSPGKKAPLILCETKAPSEVLDRFAKEQTISYARLLPQIAPLALLTNGSQIQVFQTLNKNRIPELPYRKELQGDLVNFILSREIQDALRAEAKHSLFIIDDVRTFKSLLKACHNEIRNNEGYDDTRSFDEMSKVLFCKQYEEKKNPNNNRFRLSVFDDSLEKIKVNVVKQIFDETKKDPDYSGLFTPDATIELQDRTFRKIVALFEHSDLSLTAFDVKGEAFEYFLGDTFTGGLGQYFTPRNVVEFMVDALDPKIGDKIIDPFCGTGGFLIFAFEVVGEKIRLQEFSEEEKNKWRYELSNKCIFGTDWAERTSQACKMNMVVHGDGSAGVFKHHGLVDVEGKFAEGEFAICVTNPPFGSVENDPKILAKYDLGTARKSRDRVILAIERAIRLVKPSGKIGIVVIDGILNNRKMRPVREYIKRNAWIKAVISLNKETFEGYGSRAKTTVLLLQKKETPDEGTQYPLFMAIAENTGYAPNGAQIPGNQLPDILQVYKAFARGEKIERHSNYWTALVKDRLDAEFYRRRPPSPHRDLESIKSDVISGLSQVSSDYQQVQYAIGKAFKNATFATIQLGDLLTEIKGTEDIDPDRVYRLGGVRWWGEGAFIREEKIGKKIKAKKLHRVSPGWVIYNRLFAFRGSFAVLTQEHDGCYVSGEFPTFALKPEVESPYVVAKYIVHCLNSPQYLDVIEALSTGSTKTSRNRLGQGQFLEIKIQLPKAIETTERLVQLLDRAYLLRSEQDALVDILKELREGIARLLPIPSESES
jgi:type I restriction enzyme M protein